MTKVIADITMSIDGFVTGPDPDLEHGLGHGGEPLHVWVFSDDEVDAAVLEESTERSGAVVMGRRLFDIIDGPHGWNDEMGYGADAGRSSAVLRRDSLQARVHPARARLHLRHRRARVGHPARRRPRPVPRTSS